MMTHGHTDKQKYKSLYIFHWPHEAMQLFRGRKQGRRNENYVMSNVAVEFELFYDYYCYDIIYGMRIHCVSFYGNQRIS